MYASVMQKEYEEPEPDYVSFYLLNFSFIPLKSMNNEIS